MSSGFTHLKALMDELFEYAPKSKHVKATVQRFLRPDLRIAILCFYRRRPEDGKKTVTSTTSA